MTARFAYNLPPAAIELDANGPVDQYRAFILDRASGWLYGGIPDDRDVPAGLGNWFFGVTVEGALKEIDAAHAPDDRPRLRWSGWQNPTTGVFTIMAEAPRVLWDPNRTKVIYGK